MIGRVNILDVDRDFPELLLRAVCWDDWRHMYLPLYLLYFFRDLSKQTHPRHISFMPPTLPSIPSIREIKERARQALGFAPCFWQADVCRTLLQRRKGVVLSTAATGAGKTATFWLPILFEPSGVTIIVEPLKDLSAQIATVAKSIGLSTLNVTREVLDDTGAVKVCYQLSLITHFSLILSC